MTELYQAYSSDCSNNS